jgi:hypothetical protein
MFKYDENKIQEGLRIISQVEPSSESTSRAVDKVRRTLTGETNIDSNNRMWRIIMRSPITKLAVAAVVIIAAGLAIHYFAGEGTQKCCAWTQIADKVAQFKTCVCWTHMKLSGGLAAGPEVDSKIYISSGYGYRIDTFADGNIIQQAYMATDYNAMIIVTPPQKKYRRMVLTDEALAAAKNTDPRVFVTQFAFGTLGHQKDLGKDIINGVEVRGIEVNNPPATKGVFNNFIGRMWVDTATEYPVRMEVEAEYGTGEKKGNTVQVMDGFEWGKELDPAIFEPNIPSDYTMTAETKMPGWDERSAMDGFKHFSEMAKGKYPRSIKTMMQEGMDLSTQSMQESMQQALVKDMNIVPGTQLSEAMKQELYNKAKKIGEAMQPEIMSSQVKLQGPFNFYNKLAHDGKEPVYYGKDVNAGDANSVLMRWKVSQGQYRVILGDLTVKNVNADELAELVAMTLNRLPKAIKPIPADATTCGQIADMELSWTPGLYTAKQKVYMGTTIDKLDLLAEVGSDSNLVVSDLKRGQTYYWRVDGTDANSKVVTGDVWSFSIGKLVGWWKFDESTGATASDSSGNGNNGTLKGNPVWKPQGGKIGGAIELNGKGDYVEISNESAFDINNQITISAWVNIMDVPQDWTAIVTKGDSAWRVSTSLAKNIFHFGVSSQDYIHGLNAVDSGQWHNVVCVYDRQKFSIYIDGKQDVISTPVTVPIGTNDFPVCIGENIEAKGRCFHGLIDDVRIYDYALSENEIAELNSGSH